MDEEDEIFDLDAYLDTLETEEVNEDVFDVDSYLMTLEEEPAGPQNLSEALDLYSAEMQDVENQQNDGGPEVGVTGATGATGAIGAYSDAPSTAELDQQFQALTGQGIGVDGLYDFGSRGGVVPSEQLRPPSEQGTFEERLENELSSYLENKPYEDLTPREKSQQIQNTDKWRESTSKYLETIAKKEEEFITNSLYDFENDEFKLNLSDDIYDLTDLYNIGLERKPESSNDRRVKELENKINSGQPIDVEDPYNLALYKDRQRKENNDWFQTAVLNEDGKTPYAAKIFNKYKELEINNAEAKALTTYETEVQEEGANIDDKDFYSKVNNKINESLVERAGESMDNEYGKENVDKVRNAKTAEEQRKALRELRNDPNVDIYYDPETGETINKDLLDEEEIKKQDDEFMAVYNKFQFMGATEQIQALQQIENKVAAMANSLYGSGQTGSPTLLQSLGVNWNDDKNLKQDAIDIEYMAKTGIVPASISTLPNGGNIFAEPNALVKEYNNLVETLNTARTVVGLNMDPTTLTRSKSPIGFIPFTDFDEKLLGSAFQAIPDAFNLESLNTNEMANRFVYDIMVDELGKFKTIDQEGKRTNKEKNLANLVGDRGDYYVGAAENIGSTITPLAKMSGEIMLWTALTGGTATVGRTTMAIGEIVTANAIKYGLNPKTAVSVGNFTRGVLQESWGLAGSNLIGGAVTNSDPMPVVPFAIGSQIGHMGFNWMGKVLPKAITRYAEKNPKFGTVVNFMDKYSPRTVTGALKFGTKPLIGSTAIKGGEFTSGLLDVAEGEMDFNELWSQVTDSESFWDMYGALLFMAKARPDQYSKKVVENFHYDIDNIRGNQPEWNRLARRLDLETKKDGSWTKEEVENARLKKLNEIKNNDKLSAQEKRQQREDVEFNANRLNLKRALDQVNTKMSGYENWNGLSTRLNNTIKSLDAGNSLSAEGITNIAEAGMANGGTSPILELQNLGFSAKQANDLYKGSQQAYSEGQHYFPDVTSQGYKSYVENGLAQGQRRIALKSLKEAYDNKNSEISESAYEVQKEQLESQLEVLKNDAIDLIKEAEAAREGRVLETMRQAEEALENPDKQLKELSREEFNKMRRDLGGNTESTGFGFQTTIDGKPTFVVNKDAMKEYRRGSTIKHEIYHPVFERKFSPQGIARRASEIAKEKKISNEDALFEANQEAYEYLDSFKARLKELGIFERVEQELMEVPGYKELKESGKRNLKIEKEFINEYLELQNEGTLTGLTRDVKVKDIGVDALDLKSGADAVDYFLTGIEKTEAGKEKLKQTQKEYEELQADPTIQASERTASDLAAEAKGSLDNLSLEKQKQLKKQYEIMALDALGFDPTKSNVPRSEAVSYVNQFLPGILRRYSTKRGKFSTLVNGNIRPKKQAFYGKQEKLQEAFKQKRISDKISTEGDREFDIKSEDLTPEEAMIAKQETKSETKSTTKKINPLTDYKNIADYKGKKPLEDFVDITPADVAIDRAGGQKGLQSKYGNRVAAELYFGEPGKELSTEIKKGEKISELDKAMGKLTDIAHKDGKPVMIEKKYKDGSVGMVPKPYSQNLTYAKKIKDGIPEPSEAGRIQEAFSITETAKKFLKLLHQNTASETAAITYVKEGREVNERPDVSADVKGNAVGINNKLIKLLMDPVMKTGRDGKPRQAKSSGLTSQTPMYKPKAELKNPSDALIKKFQDALGITKAGELNKYDRNIGQTLKGVAKLQGGQAVNTIYRNKIKAFDKAGTLKSRMPVNKILADFKSGVKDIQESSRKIGDQFKDRQKKAGAKHIEDLIGTVELVPRIRDVMVDKAPYYFGNIFRKSAGLLGTSVWNNSGVRIGKAIRDGMPLISSIDANVEAQAKKQAKANLKERGIEKPTERQLKREVNKQIKRINEGQDIELSREALAAGLTMEQPQLVKEILDVVKNTPELANKFSKEQLEKIDLAIGGQEAKKLKTNIEKKDDFLEGKSLLLDAYKDLLTAHPEAIDIMTQLLYHKNSNTHPLRNLATYLGTELGISKRPQNRNKPYEEHTLPFGEATLLILDAMTSKKTDWPGFKKWLNENYFQEGISSSPNAKTGDVFGYSQNILDHPMRSTGKGGEVLPVWKSKDQMHPELRKQVDEALSGKRKWEDVMSADIRKYNEYASERGYINPNKMQRFDFKDGKMRTDAQRYNVEVPRKLENDPNIIEIQNHLIHQQLIGKMSAKEAREMMDLAIKNAPERLKATRADYKTLKEPGVLNLSERMSTEDLIKKARSIDKALELANKPNKEPKKIRVFDFDDTVGTSKNKVFATKEGETKILNAEEFAKEGLDLINKGWEMDFSDFNKVTEGGKGPLFDLMKTMNEAKGKRDVFILTARAPEAAEAIHMFLKESGIDIPLENVIGLGNSTGEAKANWIVDKAAEGYNDFFFADDAYQNVKAVRDALEVIDVKSQVQQARMNASERLNEGFNKIIEQKTGIGKEKVFSDVKAEIRGAKARRQRFFIPPSAEDFLGLMYTTLPKGKQGDAALKFYQENLFDPYTRAMDNLSTSRVNLMADFKALKKQLDVPKDLRKTTESGFTNEQAVRVYMWGKEGKEIPGLSKTDLKELTDLIENNPKLKSFADQIFTLTKGDGYSTPGKDWAVGTITTDLIQVLNKTKRAKYLKPWKENADIIFSKENLNKLEAAFGKKYRDAVENSLERMTSGSNRSGGTNRLSNQVLDYINNSTGAIMFFNTRSAVLQTISSANFINWSFNNPLMAGKAFANQPQYWKDFVKLMNSDYLLDRRNGLKLNINESEIADAAKTSKNKAKAALNYILEKGYLPTKYADSFAIASGGAMFYRNRINDLVKKGVSVKDAEIQAMKEFRQVSEMSQQSSDPSKISQQQASDLGRVVLQFANTPMQYARIQKRAVQDLINGRGDPKVHVSKLAYYGFLQNLMFNALQQGMFALGFGDDFSDEEQEKKTVDTINGMLDSSLRGIGLAGVTVGVLKNLILDVYRRSGRPRPEYVDAYYKLLEFSPAIKSKLSKIKGAAYPFDSKKRRKEVFDKGFSLDNPAWESLAKVVTAVTNVPLDRAYLKAENLKHASQDDTETWMAIANFLGWPTWQLEPRKSKGKTKKPKLKFNSTSKSFEDEGDSNKVKPMSDEDLEKLLESF